MKLPPEIKTASRIASVAVRTRSFPGLRVRHRSGFHFKARRFSSLVYFRHPASGTARTRFEKRSRRGRTPVGSLKSCRNRDLAFRNDARYPKSRARNLRGSLARVHLLEFSSVRSNETSSSLRLERENFTRNQIYASGRVDRSRNARAFLEQSVGAQARERSKPVSDLSP
jgi:hypothetical protein